jgi:hypothetical protein
MSNNENVRDEKRAAASDSDSEDDMLGTEQRSGRFKNKSWFM